MKTISILIISRAIFLERKMFQKKVVETQNTHFKIHNSFFENRAVYEIMWKKTRVGKAIHDNMVHAGCLRLQIHTQVV
jgi:hypothetical protein